MKNIKFFVVKNKFIKLIRNWNNYLNDLIRLKSIIQQWDVK